MAFREKSASSILPYTCVYIGMWIVLTSRNLLICVTPLAKIYVLKQPFHVSNWQINLNGEVFKIFVFYSNDEFKSMIGHTCVPVDVF